MLIHAALLAIPFALGTIGFVCRLLAPRSARCKAVLFALTVRRYQPADTWPWAIACGLLYYLAAHFAPAGIEQGAILMVVYAVAFVITASYLEHLGRYFSEA